MSPCGEIQEHDDGTQNQTWQRKLHGENETYSIYLAVAIKREPTSLLWKPFRLNDPNLSEHVVNEYDIVLFFFGSEEVCRNEQEDSDPTTKELIRTPFHTRMPNVHVKMLHFPNEPFKEDGDAKNENKENGEKLAGLNLPPNRALFAEKRKWSDVKRSRFPKQNLSSDSSSSDEEVKELFSKQQKSSNSNVSSCEDRQQITSPVRSSKIRPSDSHVRKRHRTTAHERIYSRPSLDFEKMQQVN